MDYGWSMHHLLNEIARKVVNIENVIIGGDFNCQFIEADSNTWSVDVRNNFRYKAHGGWKVVLEAEEVNLSYC